MWIIAMPVGLFPWGLVQAVRQYWQYKHFTGRIGRPELPNLWELLGGTAIWLVFAVALASLWRLARTRLVGAGGLSETSWRMIMLTGVAAGIGAGALMFVF
jgi:hypothetical protein